MNDEWCLFLFYEISVFQSICETILRDEQFINFFFFFLRRSFWNYVVWSERSSRNVFRFFLIHSLYRLFVVCTIFVEICLFEGCNVDRFGGELKIVSDFRWLFGILICLLFLSTCREFFFHFLKPLPVDMFGCPGMASFVCCFAMEKKWIILELSDFIL